jgi:hypothetical protein
MTQRVKSDPKWNGKKVCAFFPIKGKKFDKASCRIMVVGRAVNGWKDAPLSNKSLESIQKSFEEFSLNEFAIPKKEYNINRSAFWRIVRKTVAVSCGREPEEWIEHVCWTNLFKIAPLETGNPSSYLADIQRKSCIDLLKQEVQIFKPKVVLVLAGKCWYEKFLSDLEFDSAELKPAKNNLVEGSFVDKEYRQWIFAKHPQGKDETIFVKQITDVLSLP